MKKYFLGILTFALGLTFTGCSDDDDYNINTNPIVSEVQTGDAEITAVSATTQGFVLGDMAKQASSAYEVGVCYCVNGDPKNGVKVPGTMTNDTIVSTISDLNTNVTYKYCSYITLQKKVTYYGEAKTFTTIDAKLTAKDPTNVTAAKAKLGADVQGTSNAPVEVNYGVKVSLSDDLENIKNGYDFPGLVLSGANFDEVAANLLPGKTYYYLPYINLGNGYLYASEAKSFTTSESKVEYVDLGLSVEWATYNVGAETVGEPGGLYGYGDATGLLTSTSVEAYTKGNVYGSVSDIATLMGGRLPSVDDVKELIASCSYEFTTVDGVSGAKFTAKNGKSIFLPVNGYRDGTELKYSSIAGYYWTGAGASGEGYAQSLAFNSFGAGMDANVIANGLSIRPVRKTAFSKELLCKTWYVDLDKYGDSYVFDGPLYYGDTNQSWATFAEGLPGTKDSWTYCPKYSESTWITTAQDFGSMTFTEDGKVTVDDKSNGVKYEGTYTVDEVNKTITLTGARILHLGNFDAIVSNWATELKILNVTKNGLQLGVVRDQSDEGECLLITNYISKEYYDEASKPIWKGLPASLNCCDPSWYPSVWNDQNRKTNADVTGYGTYTVTADLGASLNGVNVFTVDILGGAATYTSDNTQVTIDKITVDGNEVACNSANIVCGDIEGNGNFRIEIYNELGYKPDGADTPSTVSNPAIDKTKMVGQVVSVTFTLAAKIPQASLSVCDPNWNAQWSAMGNAGNVDVTGFGTYTVKASLSTALSSATVFCVDVLKYGTLLGESMLARTIATVDKITVDGKEIPCDNSKILYGDLENNGNFRIEIYNDFGTGTASNPPIDKSLVAGKDIEVTFTLSSLPVAHVVYASSDWSVQNWSTGNKGDIVVTKDGTYTVSFYPGSACPDAFVFCVDIDGFAKAYPSATATVDKIVLDGTTELTIDKSKILVGDLEGKGNLRMEIYNSYGTGTKDNPPIDKDKCSFKEKMEVTFTVSGSNSAKRRAAKYTTAQLKRIAAARRR